MLLTGRVPYSTNPPNKDRLKALIASKDPDFNKPYLQKLSEPCQNFLKKCFTRSLDKRPSAGDLLKDDWIVSRTENRTSMLTKDLKVEAQYMEEIINFSKFSKFSKMITSLLIGLRHDSEDLSILKDLFHKLDTNNDGTISKEEFEAAADELHDMNFFAFKDLNWDDVFKEIDLDGNGSVDFHEFCVAAVNHKKLLSTQNLKYVFATLDQDQSGTIELS